jgi:thiamine-monophosphate kinase
MVISVTIIGEAYPGRAVKRTGARAGDDIYVTGSLGDSAFGLDILKARGVEGLNKDEARLVGRHLKPSPRIKAGRLLGEGRLASAMIDISDGLSSDLGHILEQSGVGAVVYKNRLPISGELMHTAGIKKAVQYALHGGEDYELLFTARQSCRKKIAALQEEAGVGFTAIGNITAEDGAVLVDEKGQGRALRPSGYEHFRK